MKKSKKLIVLMVFVALSVFILAGCGDNEPASTTTTQPVELKLAHFFPATHPAEVELIQPWAAAIEEATEGRVIVTSYPGESLLKADAIYDGVVSGIADIGLSCFSYNRGRFPVLEVFELPGITYANSKVASQVAWEGIQELNPAEVQDTKLLMAFTTGPGDLYTKEPVHALEDLNGMEIRATGLSAKTLSCLGATPVAMAQSEAYEALTKGVVQGNLGPIEVLKGWKQAEVTGYITYTPFLYNTLFYITMNQDKWNAISPEDQAAIAQVTEKFFNEVAIGLWDKQNASALDYSVNEEGMETITLPEAEQERWIELVKPVQEEYVEQMNQNGLDGNAILNTVKSLADQYNKEYQ